MINIVCLYISIHVRKKLVIKSLNEIAFTRGPPAMDRLQQTNLRRVKRNKSRLIRCVKTRNLKLIINGHQENAQGKYNYLG